MDVSMGNLVGELNHETRDNSTSFNNDEPLNCIKGNFKKRFRQDLEGNNHERNLFVIKSFHKAPQIAKQISDRLLV
jgi:hypothetical protein